MRHRKSKGFGLETDWPNKNQNMVNRADDKTTKSYLIIIFLLKFSKVININQLNIVKKIKSRHQGRANRMLKPDFPKKGVEKEK